MQRLGDGALRFRRPDRVGARRLLERLRSWPGVTDVVVTTEHACIYFDPSAPPDDPTAAMGSWASDAEEPSGRLVTIRARYDGEDLAEVAERTGLRVDEVAAVHASATYTVTMIGFLPGFAYLQGIDPRLALPRRAPRTRVPRGAIGIASGYTGIYPFASPGGWNLIGSAVAFEAFASEGGATLALGDSVRFERVA
jgi:UPF0271 protein